ncbi:hypothetical protein MUK42_33006 [Musa troglodytarum]|uniref:Uncharacterized protein n=1 Tax=Musa troglodytarum TaxID=320322 RepID=A0A9E7F8H0_9LILI|nr:hypothetical protein MUK42_33006 [Musa troglodytarum]
MDGGVPLLIAGRPTILTSAMRLSIDASDGFCGWREAYGQRAKAYGMTSAIILRGTQSVVSWRLVSSTCVHGLIPCSSSGFVWWPTDMAEEPLGGHLNSTHAMRT